MLSLFVYLELSICNVSIWSPIPLSVSSNFDLIMIVVVKSDLGFFSVLMSLCPCLLGVCFGRSFKVSRIINLCTRYHWIEPTMIYPVWSSGQKQLGFLLNHPAFSSLSCQISAQPWYEAIAFSILISRQKNNCDKSKTENDCFVSLLEADFWGFEMKYR